MVAVVIAKTPIPHREVLRDEEVTVPERPFRKNCDADLEYISLIERTASVFLPNSLRVFIDKLIRESTQ